MKDDDLDALSIPEVSVPVKCPMENCFNELRPAPMHVGGRGTITIWYCDAGHNFDPGELAQEWGWRWESARLVPPAQKFADRHEALHP